LISDEPEIREENPRRIRRGCTTRSTLAAREGLFGKSSGVCKASLDGNRRMLSSVIEFASWNVYAHGPAAHQLNKNKSNESSYQLPHDGFGTKPCLVITACHDIRLTILLTAGQPH